MTNFWKRSIAFLLTLCMTLSVLPPMVFAVEGTQSPSQSVTYDFGLEKDELGLTQEDGTTPFDGTAITTAAIADRVKAYYDNEVINWRYDKKSHNYVGKFGNSTSATSWDGLVIYKSGNTTPYWTSFILRAPAAGEYDLTLNIQQSKNGAVGKVWILPGAQTTATINTAIAEQNPVFDTVDCKGSSTVATYNDASLSGHITVGNETVLTMVVQNPGNTKYINLVSLVADKADTESGETTAPNQTTAPQETTPAEPMDYNFCLNGNSNFTLPDGTTPFDKKTLTSDTSVVNSAAMAVKGYYDSDVLNWYPYYFTTRNSAATFGDSERWNGLRTDTSSGEGYMAMIIRAPGEGEYDLVLNHQTFNKGGAGEMYILPGTPADTEIAGLVAAATPAVAFNCASGEAVYKNAQATGSYTFGAEETCTLVFKLTEGGSSKMIYVLSLHAEPADDTPEETTVPNETTVPEETTTAPEETTVAPEETTAPEEVTPAEQMDYNFQLNGDSNFTVDGAAFNGKSINATNAVTTAIKAYYNAGALNWYPRHFTTRNAAATFGDSGKWDGLRTDTSSGEGYMSMIIRAPGEGKYDLVLNYQTFNKGGAGEVYILPGTPATTEIAGLVATATPAVAFNCASGDALYDDAKAIGSYTFGAEKTCTLVFKLTEGGGSKMIYVRSLIAYTEGKMPVEPEKPIVQLDKAEYNFAQVEDVRGLAFPTGKQETLNALYRNDELNWNYAGRSINNQAAVMGGVNPQTGKNGGDWTGMRFAAKTGGGWVAYTIQSPGTGEYHVSVGYQAYAKLGDVSVYVLPGDTTKIDDALKTATPIGSYSCYEDIAQYLDMSAKMDKTVSFEAGKEYIFVFYIANETETPIYACVNSVKVKLPGVDPEEDMGGQAVQLDKAEYNFAQVESVHGTAMPVGKDATLTSMYLNGEINWDYAGRSKNNQAAIYGGINPATGKNAGAWTGMRFAAKTGGGWVAYKLQSPGTGHYLVNVHFQQYSGLGAAKTYVLPGNTKNIDEALQNASSIGVYSCFQSGEGYKDASRVMSKSVQLTAGEEYIFVFYIENLNQSPIYATVNGVTLERTPNAVNNEKGDVDQMLYDFNLGDTDLKYQDQSLVAKNVAGVAVGNLIKGFYYDEIINWTFRAGIPKAAYTATFGSIAGGKVWDGLVMYAMEKGTGEPIHNFYYAFNIRSPGTGDYKLTVDYGVHMQGAGQGSVYILPAGTADIAAAIAEGKAVGTINYDNGSIVTTDPMEHGRTTFGNPVSLERGKEYILVFTSDVLGRANSRLYVDSAMLTKVGVDAPADIIPYRKPIPKPIPAGSTVYNMDLCDPMDHLWTKKTSVLGVMDVLTDRYKTGVANWIWATQQVAAADTIQFTTTGLNVTSAEMEWIAVKIKSPGKGLYTVGMNHGIGGYGGTGAVYILPVDTKDINAALDPSCRVGFVNFNNNTGVAAVDDGYQTMAGTWEFGDDKEYIVVIEGFKASTYSDKRNDFYLSQLFLTPGNVMEEAEEEKVISSVVVHPGPLKMLDGCYYGTTSLVGGCNYLFMPIEGGKILVIDLDNNVLVYEIKVPFGVTRGITTDENGIVWVVGDSYVVFRFDPYTRTGETKKSFRPEVPTVQSCVYLDYADGCLYMGTSPSGVVVKYDIATDTYTSLGGHEDCSYAAAVVYKDGYVYSGMNGDSNGDGKKTWVVAKINVETGETVYTDVYDLLDPARAMFYGAGFAGDLLLIGAEPIQGQETLIAIDTNTMEVVDLGVKASISYGISEEMDGKVYFVLSGLGLHYIDVQTREVRPANGAKDMLIPVRCCARSFVELEDPMYPGPSIVTYNGKGAPRIYNLETGKVKSYNDIIDPEYGNATTARPIINGLPGSNELYIGGFNTDNCAIYNTETGEVKHFTSFSAQTDAMVWYKDVLYTGNYTAGCITRINLEDEAKNQVLLTLNDDIYDQARIHTLIAADDLLIAGSTPDKFKYGGCLAIMDLNTLERTVVQNIVQDQTVNCVAYHDGLVYGTTSIHGGTGAPLRTDLSAKLFIYDVEKKEKVGEFDLRNYLEGFTKNIGIVYGVAPDPNVEENGKFWGMVSETLFSFTYNKDTGKLSVKEELSFRKDVYPYGGGWSWFPRTFCFDDSGNLYVSFGSVGGFRRVNTKNPADNEMIMDYPTIYYTLGEDGNLYYLHRTALRMHPLNVTEEDWAQADEVDQMILALDEEITLKSEEAIVAARQAYEALDFTHKALIQKLYLLEEAESDLLELQIAELPATVTLEHEELILGLQAKYDAMTLRQQKYVKNYADLSAAVTDVNVLLDKQAAAEVQAMIDTIKDLGEITLEHKDRIAEIRAAYNKLFSYQRQYVDATDLLEAEAVLAVLRAQAIERLKELIASIGEVTLEDEPIIVEADGIFSWLTMMERQQVDGAALSSAKIQLSKLQKAAAAEVDALIGKIGKVGIFSGGAISKARKAYDALTEGSKAYVSLIDALIAAEKAFKPIAIALWCVGGVVVAGGGAATVVVLTKKKRKAAAPAQATETEN